MNSMVSRLILPLAVCALTGCPASTSNPDAGDGSVGDSALSTDSSPDGTDPGDAQSDTPVLTDVLVGADTSLANDTGLSTTEFKRGTINLFQSSFVVAGMTFNSASESVSIVNVPVGSTATVSETTSGNCSVLRVAGPAMTPTGMYAVSGGTITVAGGNGNAINLMPAADGTYMNAMQNLVRFNGGDMITVSASGATVPAFQGMITIPPKANLTSPAMPPTGTSLMITRSNGFTSQWISTGPGIMRVLVIQSPAAGQAITIDCSFDFTGGSGTVSPAVLANLTPGVNATVVIGSSTTTRVTAGTYPVNINAVQTNLIATATVQQ